MVSNAPESVAVGSGEPSLADDLRALGRAFYGRWRLIAVIVAVFLTTGIAYVWTSRPAYTSSVDLFIDPRERSLVDVGAARTGMGSSSQGADAALVESQIAILGSRSVLGALIQREGLENDPEFNADPSGPTAALRGWVKALLYGPNVDDFTRTTRFDRALARLQSIVRVRRVAQTYVLNISVTTASPTRSARLADSIAAIYLSEGQHAVDDSARESARSLEARLVELRRASEESQRAVEDYRRENGLMGTQGVLIDERRLTELSAQVVSASVAADAARVTLENLRRGDNEAITSEIATRLRIQIEQARSEENAVVATYGARHPRLVPIRETRASLERALAAEIDRVVTRAASDYENARKKETSLEAMLRTAEDRLAQSNTASVRLRELEQIAARDRTLYDTFATKAKQAREQIALPTTTARIISQAEPASTPSEPKVALVLSICLFLGGVVGLAVAWLLHLFVGPPRPRRGSGVAASTEHRTAAAP
jgi:succinoglycan biosynthesis transport protein ExoP